MPASYQVEHLVIVMMENRSFDHMLGYLSLPPSGRRDIDGFVAGAGEPADLSAYSNAAADGTSYQPYHLAGDPALFDDDDAPPHERDPIAQQMAVRPDGSYAMNGFVRAYNAHFAPKPAPVPPQSMAYFTDAELPVTAFFAQNYLVCTRWFAPLPAATQPNRLMALGGYSLIDHDCLPVPNHQLVYYWLNYYSVPWRVYYAGLLPFCSIIANNWDPHYWDDLLLHSQHYSDLAEDVAQHPQKPFPQVTFIEPSYYDVPGPFRHNPNDNHPPMQVGPGEAFLRDLYTTLSSNPALWAKTAIIITYDEHGGFYDHVPPLAIRTDAPRYLANYPSFLSTGPRVPSLIVSPLVQAAGVYAKELDHTSVLNFIARSFFPSRTGGVYSNYTEQRFEGRPNGGSIQEAIDSLAAPSPRSAVPIAG